LLRIERWLGSWVQIPLAVLISRVLANVMEPMRAKIPQTGR
jgi:hypothetical protein